MLPHQNPAKTAGVKPVLPGRLWEQSISSKGGMEDNRILVTNPEQGACYHNGTPIQMGAAMGKPVLPKG